MEQVIQLKTMRDEALARLQLNPDFKLVNSLDALIKDLESVLAPQETVAVAVAVAENVNAEEKISDEQVQTASPQSDTESAPDVSIDDDEQNDDVSGAIEALEAELSQGSEDKLPTGTDADQTDSQPGAMVN